MWCCLIKYFTKLSYLHILLLHCLPVIYKKKKFKFKKIKKRYYFERKPTCRTILVSNFSVEWFTDCTQSDTNSCKICLTKKFPFEVITTEFSHQTNQHF